MHRRLKLTMFTVPALLAGSLLASVSPVYAACDVATSLENGGFEVPGVGPGGFGLFDSSLTPPWLTTDVSNEVEIWGDGFIGVPSAEGENFAELNANSAGTLYQDIVTSPGDIMTWTLQHRGRAGDEAMRVLIGDEATADVDSDAGWDFISADLVDGIAAWGAHTDAYVVPAGQLCTRFAFRAVDPGSVGNFIDGISFTITTPAPEPTAAPTAPPTDGLPDGDSRSDGSPVGLLIVVALAGLAVSIRRTVRSNESRQSARR